MIFYEAPHKLRATLDDMADVFGGERKIALCRELTKLNEEAERCTLADAVKLYKEKEPRGEYVLVVEGGSGKTKEENPLLSLSPEEHDEIIGYVSQLTHCIAVSLMTAKSYDNLEEYTGDSFRDLTRIARINDEMWSELFLLNRDELLREMDSFIAEFGRFRYMLAMGDREGMRETMRASTARRAMFDKPKK